LCGRGPVVVHGLGISSGLASLGTPRRRPREPQAGFSLGSQQAERSPRAASLSNPKDATWGLAVALGSDTTPADLTLRGCPAVVSSEPYLDIGTCGVPRDAHPRSPADCSRPGHQTRDRRVGGRRGLLGASWWAAVDATLFRTRPRMPERRTCAGRTAREPEQEAALSMARLRSSLVAN
jgi:hypothetical protein